MFFHPFSLWFFTTYFFSAFYGWGSWGSVKVPEAPTAHMSGIDTRPGTCSLGYDCRVSFSSRNTNSPSLGAKEKCWYVQMDQKTPPVRLTFQACFASCDFYSLLAKVWKGRKTYLSSRVRLIYSLLSLPSLNLSKVASLIKNKPRSRKKTLCRQVRPFDSGSLQDSLSWLSFLANFTSLLGMICLLLLTPYSTADMGLDLETIPQSK